MNTTEWKPLCRVATSTAKGPPNVDAESLVTEHEWHWHENGNEETTQCRTIRRGRRQSLASTALGLARIMETILGKGWVAGSRRIYSVSQRS